MSSGKNRASIARVVFLASHSEATPGTASTPLPPSLAVPCRPSTETRPGLLVLRGALQRSLRFLQTYHHQSLTRSPGRDILPLRSSDSIRNTIRSLLLPRTMTPVPKNFGIPALSVFSCFRLKLFPMSATSLQRCRRIAVWLALDLAIASALLAFTAWADSSAKHSSVPSSGCYCCCGPSRTAGGCAKMCDLAKNAGRRWAVTCSKPRAKTPSEAPGAGPHLSRPARTERASN